MLTLPRLLSRLPFRNHSTHGDGFPSILHLNRSFPFASTRKSPLSPLTCGALAAKTCTKGH